jgi:NAD(P)-dependent dehydrogenase (short-subunit alcohol dehydrogenase family)
MAQENSPTGSKSDPLRARGAPRVALVTGGAQRIGRAIALALARDGWEVAVHYHRSRDQALATVEQIRALGRRAHAVALDLATAVRAEPLFESCEDALGVVQCLVNNASQFVPDTATDFTPAGFEAHLRVNTAAPLLLARTLHARLPADVQGVVVNLLDQKLWNPNPDFFTYTLSKAALEAATGLLARALAPRVRVVGVAPGISLPAHGQSQAGFEAAHRATPLGHSSTPDDIAHAVAFLADAPAITGTTLLVDGGQHLVPTQRDILFLKP